MTYHEKHSMIKPVNNGNRGANLKSNRPEAAESPGGAAKGGFAETGIFREMLQLGYSLTGCALSPEGGGAIASWVRAR